MEHVCPEDWPGILRRFREALKPSGALYLSFCTRELEEAGTVERAYERAKEQGLPVVFGEVADQVEEGLQFFLSYEDVFEIPEEAFGERADVAVYHYYPALEQVRAWVDGAELVVEEEGTSKWYQHFLMSKRATHAVSDS
jgi:hypothetical protein